MKRSQKKFFFSSEPQCLEVSFINTNGDVYMNEVNIESLLFSILFVTVDEFILYSNVKSNICYVPTDDLTSTVTTELTPWMLLTMMKLFLQKSTVNQIIHNDYLNAFFDEFNLEFFLKPQLHLLSRRVELPEIYFQLANVCKNLQFSCHTSWWIP